jgi:hypothetical protein
VREELGSERGGEAVDESFVVGGRILAFALGIFGVQSVGLAPASGGASVIAARVEDVGQPEQQAATGRGSKAGFAQQAFERGEVGIGQLVA